MVLTLLGALAVGGVFGLTMQRSGLSRYSTIVRMFLLQDLKAMKFMFTGVIVATLGYALAGALGLGLTPRVNPFLGPAHLIGGIIFGVGMALAGQ